MLLRTTYSLSLIRSFFAFFLTLSAVNSFAQVSPVNGSDKIRLEIVVMSDKKDVADSMQVIVRGFEDSSSFVSTVSNHFIIPLNYHDKYVITVSKRNCSTKVLYLDTDCPVGNWALNAEVTLSTKNRNVVKAGMLKYNAELQTFVRYAVK